ncbi:MAG: hypothetical protein SWH68_00660 [Thermodesulfobacteriota bacterium]|nr:hypothetical protein [Thermodesulfobacteriota bacterium]
MTNPDEKNMEQIMAEADQLINELDALITEDMEEQKRIRLEQAAQKLKKAKADPEKVKAAKKRGPLGDGIHEAIDEVIKAMKEFGHHDH